MNGKVMLWRWRRNPLKRRSDVAEAWVALAAGVLLAVGAPAVGTVTGMAVENSVVHQNRSVHQASAVLTQDAPTGGNPYGGDGQVRASVRWTAPDGSTRTGRALVPAGSEAGSRTRIWLDEDGALGHRPGTDAQAAAQGVVVGGFAGFGTGLLVLSGRWAVRMRLDRRRAVEWEREWAEIGPQWGGHRTA